MNPSRSADAENSRSHKNEAFIWPESKQPRILVVDDEADTRANLVDILELFGYHTEAAESGADALAHPSLGAFDVIVLDRRLPDVMADTLLPELIEHAPQTSVIIATAYADLDGTIGALRAGASDYLLKPINPDALRLSIERIRERRNLEQVVLRSERLAAIGTAMTALAHQSRNALQRSQASLDLLCDELAENEFASKLLQQVRAAQSELHRLYEDVREYARPIQIDPKMVGLGALIQDAWRELAHKRTDRDATLHFDSTLDEVECEIEPFLIKQVFENVLDNSIGAIDGPIEIVIRCESTTLDGKDAVEVAIQDNGPGFSNEALEQAFNEFYTSKTRGSGLGLAIARRFVEAHHGRIRIESNPVGARVSVCLLKTQH